MKLSSMKLYLVCVDQERGRYLAYNDAEGRGWGHTEEAAIVDLLVKSEMIVIQRVEHGE